MTLGRLALAWLAVAVWTMAVTFGVTLLVAAKPVDQTAALAVIPKSLLTWRLVEALVLTLCAALWFGSLGSGGWWLLFLLIGVLAIGPRWQSAFNRSHLVEVLADLARYVVAGAILAWLLR
ncbi:MAG TPA: hypothetical protein VEU73_05430 [Gemmatimonadales bacterium]|nr:hypothetical protein [Gemmatimonadales bacterium]